MNKLSMIAALGAALLSAPAFADDRAKKPGPIVTDAPPAAPKADKADQPAQGLVTTDTVVKAPAADADMQKVLDTLASLGGKPIATLTPAVARSQPSPADAVKRIIEEKTKKPAVPEAVGKVEDVTYTSAGKQIAARVYTPKAAAPKGKTRPVILYFRGGGWVIASLDTYDATPRALANQTGAIVVSADYRMGPENKFPAAHDDAYAAYQWVRANAATWGGDPDRLALGGESAGGNLAINTAIKARDAKEGAVAHMLLVYPVAGNDMNTESYKTNANAKPLDKPMMEWFVKHALGSPQTAADPRINLVSRTDLAGLPPATVVTAEIDPLRSEGQALAKALGAAGVKVKAIDVKGVAHEFFGMGAVVAKAKTTLAASAKEVKASLATAPKAPATSMR